MAWGSSQEATAVLVAVNYFQAHGMLVNNSSGEVLRTITEEAGQADNDNLIFYTMKEYKNKRITCYA